MPFMLNSGTAASMAAARAKWASVRMGAAASAAVAERRKERRDKGLQAESAFDGCDGMVCSSFSSNVGYEVVGKWPMRREATLSRWLYCRAAVAYLQGIHKRKCIQAALAFAFVVPQSNKNARVPHPSWSPGSPTSDLCSLGWQSDGWERNSQLASACLCRCLFFCLSSRRDLLLSLSLSLPLPSFVLLQVTQTIFRLSESTPFPNTSITSSTPTSVNSSL